MATGGRITAGQQMPESESAVSIASSLRIQRALMTSLHRLLQGIVDTVEQSQEFYEGNIARLRKLWNEIETLNYRIWELSSSPEEQGYDYGSYLDTEVLVHNQIINLSTKSRGQTSSAGAVQQSCRLPKISIPKFDGDYLKWQQFYDIFSEMVHKTSIPPIQKMWYLKSNLTGEAERVIRHLTLTQDNYSIAWKALQDRYQNRRVLASTLLQRIIGHPILAADNASSSALKNLHATIHESILALQNLGIDTSSWDPILLHILVKKLDRQSHMLYEQSLKNPKEIQTIKEFLLFLEHRFQSLEALGGRERPTSSRATASIAATSSKKGCSYCSNEDHPIYYCDKFLKLAVSDRLNWVQRQRLCVNCFKHDHSSKMCKAKSCSKCSKRHNSLLHLNPTNQVPNEKRYPENSKQHSSREVTVSNASVTLAAAEVMSSHRSYVLLATAKIRITATNGQSGEFRALLDSGSQINIVTERLIKRLNIVPSKAALRIEGIGDRTKNATQRINFELQARTTKFSTRVEAFVLPNIVPVQPAQLLDVSSWSIPENIQLADPAFYEPGKIDVLLGAEFYVSLMSTGRIELSPELPILQNTLLGWIISGKINNDSASNATTCAIFSHEECSTDELIQKFWKLDDIDGTDTNLTLADKHCETHFKQNTIRNSEGRFVVKLPLSDHPSSLGDSRTIAFKRFLALETRMAKTPALKTQYVEFMKQYIELGHMSEISLNDIQHPHCFIPHHCVLKPSSTTTQLRVVFDASAKTSSGLSLNDIMYTGPTVQSDLFSILLRFRLPRFVFTTDIEKMYRQILIDQADRSLQLILWRETETDPLKHYQLNTVTYGTSSAPYLATKCLQQLAERNIERFPLGAQVLRDNFYVDDGVSGSDSLMTAMETQKQLTTLLQEAGFKLRKWCANHPKLLQGIPPQDQEVNLDFENASTKTLGLTWIPKADNFCVTTNLENNSSITKRTIISDTARIFDPLGLAGPVVITAKIFIQQLWQLKLAWDDSLPLELEATWSTFRNELRTLKNACVPRHVFNGQRPSTIQIHTFVDASERAYGAAIYLRSKLPNNSLIIRLLCAKSRVAPLKRQTLPRLELCAAVLGAELTSRVRKDLQLTAEISYFWSDSEIVLSWINSSSASLRTFVANRVSKIQDLTIPTQWRHVSSKENPADVISRGLQPTKLMTCNLWFYGPLFLHGNSSHWPKPFVNNDHISTDPERKPKVQSLAATTSTGLEDIVYNINHRNSFKILQRVMAYVLRFIQNLKINVAARTTQVSLSVEELNAALTVIIAATQSSDFNKEIKQIKAHHEIDSSSSLKGLAPFIDDNGTLRVGGRLAESTLSFDAKHPMLLPYNDPIAKLILEKLHIDNFHCGPQNLLAASRQKFWIIKGKIMARSVVQHCIRCTKAKPKLFDQIMGNLPASRVTPTRPFSHTGVDFCGPFWVHYKIRGKKPHKVYIAVYCCFATKAVHLEVVTDLTTEAFIGSLKRFVSRRGQCDTIYCDNATNFVGASNKLEELKDAFYTTASTERIIRTCSDRGINFKFIPPRAPHFGGLWEAAVKSAKQLMLRSVSTASLTHEELETLVTEIEAILNSRPLTPLSSDPNDLAALTPGHFLIGEPLTAHIDRSTPHNTATLSTRWKLVTQLKYEFWNRWSREYLNLLQQRHKWNNQSENVHESQLVIIKEDNVPVLSWPLGRIEKVYKGNDGKVRVADVKTASGILKRPVHRLAPLFNQEEDIDNPSVQKERTKLRHRPASDEDSNYMPPKRRKSTTNPLMLTILLSLLLLPAVLGTTVHLKQFGSDPGLYFEGIGTTRIITAEWKLLVYYDLAPFWTEIRTFSAGIATLQNLCSKTHQPTTCDTLAKNFEYTRDELLQDKDTLSTSRKRRAALNIVGNVARTLFGVLDSDYAEEMSKTISQVKANRDHILQLLQNHTSIIDSTLNIIKQDEITTKSKITDLQDKIDLIMNTLDDDSNQIRLIQIITSLTAQLTLMVANLQQIHSEIINVLTDTHHGKISPLLLTPQQLKNVINSISGHLPPARSLPVDSDNLIQLYKIMKAEGAVTKNEVIFEIKLPLIDHQHFDLFHITPIPTKGNKGLISIETKVTFLAANSHRDQFIYLSSEDLNSCFTMKGNLYICDNKRPKFSRESSVHACEFHMFNNKSTTQCRLNQLQGKSSWTQLQHRNVWIFATMLDIEISVVCDIQATQLTLTGSGLLTMSPNCSIKSDGISIQGHHTSSTVMHTSYIRFKEISKTTTSDELRQRSNTTVAPFETQLEQLTALQTRLANEDVSRIPEIVLSNSRHHHAVSYTALLLSITILVSCILWILKHRRTVNRSVNVPPKPPRMHTDESSFTVRI